MSLFTRLILLYLCIAIACTFYRPDLVLGNSPQAGTVLNFFNINGTNNPDRDVWSDEPNITHINDLSLSSDSSNSTILLKSGCQGALCSIQGFVDGLNNVLGYIGLTFNALFSPFQVMASAGIPTALLLIIGLPLVFMFLVSIVMMIRGYP